MKFYYITWIKRGALLGILLTFAIHLSAQSDLTSPYTVFGPGIPNFNQTVSQAGMGGAGVALFDPYKMNYSNPANLAYHLEPIFEISGLSKFSTFSTNEASFKSKSFITNNISLSFPIKRGVWGLSIGLRPYTTVGYNVVTTVPNSDLEVNPVSRYSGDGGISQSYIGMAHKFLNKVDSMGNVRSFSFGANFNFNFGTVDNNRSLEFPGSSTSQGLRITETTLMRDASYDFGLQYQTNIVKRTLSKNRYLKLLLGATYSLGIDLNARRSSHVYNFYSSQFNPGDTLYSSERVKGIVRIPTKYTLGMGLDYITNHRQRFRFGLDYTTQNWSEYDEEFPGETKTFDFQDSHRLTTGIEYTPQIGSNDYLDNVEYRAGFYFEQSNLNIKGTDINDVGMSFGLSLPLARRRGLTKSSFNISGQYGVYGTTNNDLIKENYFKIFVGFSFTPHFRNRWFVQPKYD